MEINSIAVNQKQQALTLQYCKSVSSSNNNLIPIIYVHGFAGSKASFGRIQEPLTLALARDGYAIDLPGHGGSDMGQPTLDCLVEGTRGFLDALQIPKAHFVVHSMGGLVGLGMAVSHHDRVASLTAICASGFGSRAADAHEKAHQFLQVQNTAELLYFANRLYVHPEAFVTEAGLEGDIKYLNKPGVRDFLFQLEDALNNPENISLYKKLSPSSTFPIAAYFGTHDPIIPPPAAQTLPRFMKIVEGPMSHRPHTEDSETIIALIRKTVTSGDLRLNKPRTVAELATIANLR